MKVGVNMPQKVLKFRDGTELCIFASQTADWTDEIIVSNTPETSTLFNAFVAAGDMSGNLINTGLAGKSFIDPDGNTWAFSNELSGSISLTITKPSGATNTVTMSLSQGKFYAIFAGPATNGYRLYLASYYPTIYSVRQESGTIRYLRMGYINGVSGNYNFSDDVSLVKPENNYINCYMRNLIPGDNFVNTINLRLGNQTPVSLYAINYYSEPWSSSSIPSVPFIEISADSLIDKTPPDPYEPGGESDVGGGTGTFDGTSVDVDFATLPTLSAVDTGFITLYNPTLVQLQSLATYMWSGLFDIDTFKKLFADPMQAILGLSIVPGPVPNGGTQNVRIGNIDSGISMTKAAAQYIDIDCGTLNVEEFWGAYLDYEPYTKAEIFLPFIGVHQISIDDIMNKSVHIKYHIDLLSGGCACEIKCGGSVLYTFIGSCAVSIPVTGTDWTNLINGVLSAASAIGTMVATGGASAPAAVGTLASTAVNSLKPSIEKSGSIAGAGGLLAGKVPVLILTRPRQALPGKQNTFTGYPAFITRSLGSLSGYTEVHSIRLSGIDGTEAEIDEIEELLKGGVIL